MGICFSAGEGSTFGAGLGIGTIMIGCGSVNIRSEAPWRPES